MNQSIAIRTKTASIYSETELEKLWREDALFRDKLPTRNFRVSIKMGKNGDVSYFSLCARDKADAFKNLNFLVGMLIKEHNVERAAYNLEGMDEWHFISNSSFNHMKKQSSVLGGIKRKIQKKLVELFELEEE